MYVGRINYIWKSLFQIDQRTHMKRLTDRQRYGQINGQMDGRTEFVLQMDLPSYLQRITPSYRGRVSSHRQSRFERATWSPATFVCSHHSLRLLALNMCSCCQRDQWKETRFWSSLETRPEDLSI